MASKAAKRLKNTDGTPKSLARRQFDLTNATAGERSLVASFKASVPLRIRDNAAARIAFTTIEEFTTDGTAGNTETFNLSHNAVETVNTRNFLLYDDGALVDPAAVDYAGNSFDYTDGGTASTLHAVYVARDPGLVTVEKVAPKTNAAVREDLTEDTTSALADRDQNKEPVTFEFGKPLEGVVPTDWEIHIYVDAPAAVRWDDTGLATENGDVATNAIIDLPIVQYDSNVKGLSNAVKASALGLSG